VTTLDERKGQDEDRYVFKNRRAQMYGMVRMRLDPDAESEFGLPTRIMTKEWGGRKSLRDQLRPIPLTYDDEGRLVLLPKTKYRVKGTRPELDAEHCLVGIIGHSPDEADALALAVYGLRAKPTRRRAGAVI
jgi:hypothetical protein